MQASTAGLRIGARVGALLLAVMLSGCSIYQGYVARTEIKRTEKAQQEARNKDAPKYASDTYEQADRLLENARKSQESKSYEDAAKSARDAAAKYAEAIGRVDANRLNITKKQKDLDEVVQAITAKLQQAEQSGAAQAAPDVLAQAQQAAEQVPQAVQGMKAAAVQRPQDYDAKSDQLKQVLGLAERAYNMTLKEAATKQYDELTKAYGQLVEIKAGELVHDAFVAAESKYQSLQAQVQNEEFENALQAESTLGPELAQVLDAARQQRGQSAIDKVRGELDKAQSLGGQEYAAEAVKAASEALDSAFRLQNLKDYDAAFNMANLADQHVQQALADLSGRGQELLKEAEAGLAEAATEEAGKYAPQLLEQARAARGEAELALEANKIREGLDSASRAVDLAHQALKEAKKTKAKAALAVAETENQRAVKEGAPKYVPEVFAQAQQILDTAREKFKAEQYIEVHPIAAQAAKAMDDVLTALRASADKYRQQAIVDYQQAVSARGERYAADMMHEADQALAMAKAELERDALLASHQAAEKVTELSHKAMATAYRAHTQEMLQNANLELAEGRQAGALEYDPADFNAALNAVEATRAEQTRGELAAADEQATKAQELSHAARVAKITAAEQAVLAAQTAGAEKYDAANYQQASGILAQSKLAMENKDYAASRQLADQAKQQAGQAEAQTWKLRSEEDRAKLEQQIANLTAQGAGEKAPTPLELAVKAQGEAEASYSFGKFQEAETNAATGLQRVDEGLKALDGEVGKAIDRLLERQDYMQKLASDEFGRAQVLTVSQVVEQMRAARLQKNFAEAFRLEKEGLAQTGDLQRQLEAHNLEVADQILEASLTAYEANGLALLLPERIKSINEQRQLYSTERGTVAYPEAMSHLKALHDELGTFTDVGLARAEDRIAALRKTLNEVRQAGGEKLLSDEFACALDAYKRAQDAIPEYNYTQIAQNLDRAEQLVNGLQNDTETRILEDKYSELLRSYLLEMSALTQQYRPITDNPPELILASKSSEGTDVFRQLVRDLPPDEFLRRAQQLQEKVKETQAPPTLAGLASLADQAFAELVGMAQSFRNYAAYREFQDQIRREYLLEGYTYYKHITQLRESIERVLANKPVRKVPGEVSVSVGLPAERSAPTGSTGGGGTGETLPPAGGPAPSGAAQPSAPTAPKTGGPNG